MKPNLITHEELSNPNLASDPFIQVEAVGFTIRAVFTWENGLPAPGLFQEEFLVKPGQKQVGYLMPPSNPSGIQDYRPVRLEHYSENLSEAWVITEFEQAQAIWRRVCYPFRSQEWAVPYNFPVIATIQYEVIQVLKYY